jgi:hypothetical protein
MSDTKPNVFPKAKTEQVDVKTQSEIEYAKKSLKMLDEVWTKESAPGLEAAHNEMYQLNRQKLLDRIKYLEGKPETPILEKVNNNFFDNLPKDDIKPKVEKQQPISTPTKKVIDEDKIAQLSQPQYNMSFDVIPLPSDGKLYRNKKKTIKIAYMSTADEDILTSPNILNSGRFLEILINRKILEPDLRYRDLHIGDRNAIMLWLRATSYGEMYPVTLLDENDETFETEIDLTKLKTIKLNVEPDSEGYFDFVLPVTKIKIKFKLLSVGDVDDIEEMLDDDKERDELLNKTSTYALERQIVDVNGNRNRGYIKDFVQTMRIGDSKALRKWVEGIESGIDLNIEVGTPGGGSIKTFLPISSKFFWPDL